MTKTDLVSYLRLNVQIQDKSIDEDTAYLKMTDEEILLYLQIALNRDFPNESLDSLPNDCIYPLILLSKKELFYALAVASAPDYGIGADNNNYLKRDERFKHYMALVKQASDEYEKYLEDGGAGGHTLNSYNVTLSERYYTKYNYEYGIAPALSLFLDESTADYVKISWKAQVSSHFDKYEVYVSDSPIVDLSDLDSHISATAIKVAEIADYHQTSIKIFTEELHYPTLYIAVVCTAKNHRKAYAQVIVGD